MRFDKIIPSARLAQYIKHYVISETGPEGVYKIFPGTSLVIGFQYRGRLSTIKDGKGTPLDSSGITGLSDSYKVFGNAPDTGTILVYFTELGLAAFTSCPANELFDQSVSLDHVFTRQKISDTEERLAQAGTDKQRLRVIEQFLLSQLKDIRADKLVIEAVKLIYASKGTIRIGDLNKLLYTSQSPLEKRFRRLVGATPKRFASIVRFNTVLEQMGETKSLTDLCYENHFFDQAHFIKDFRHFTGESPERFKRPR